MKSLYKRVADLLLDRFCEVESPSDCIKYLLQAGFTKEELIELLFDSNDIDNSAKELKEEKEEQ